MSTLRLPDEVCEEIIDNCRSFLDDGDWSLEESYQVLHACSLTCQAWLPRSRLRLYSVLLFRRHRDVGSYLETLATYPFLGDLPRTMVINSTEECIPFANEELAQRLPNIRTLWLAVDMALYSSKYLAMAGQYSITQLYAHFQPTAKDIGHLIRLLLTLPNLRQLHMASASHGRILKPASFCPPLSDADVLRTAPAP
ncbi:uncharacterized protein TRAVEDRAFT_29168, partial [Trametes versicolor FP-101664 SS1]|uniref:uncharacterized protein n=1 Tax=Trametes versicolor (strain FP-101664) TaxID=717944 RepID=UPI0004621BED